MDAWSFANGKRFDENIYSNFFTLEDILDKKVMEAMEKCKQKEDENSCLLIEEYEKELGAKVEFTQHYTKTHLFPPKNLCCSSEPMSNKSPELRVTGQKLYLLSQFL